MPTGRKILSLRGHLTPGGTLSLAQILTHQSLIIYPLSGKKTCLQYNRNRVTVTKLASEILQQKVAIPRDKIIVTKPFYIND